MAFFDTFPLPNWPTINSDNFPWDWKWGGDRDYSQVYRGEDWVDARGTFLSPSLPTAGYMSWSRRESLRHDHALGYETDEHVGDFSPGRGSHSGSDFDPYNDGYAEVPECSDQFTTGSWAQRQTEKGESRVPLCDIHSGRPGGWYAEWSKTPYRGRHRESRQLSPDQSMSEEISMSEETGYAPCYGYYAYSTLPIRLPGTCCGERACPWTRVHAEQNLESSEDITYPMRGSSSDDENQVFTYIDNTKEYGPLRGWRNSEDESNETNVLPPLDRRCESIVDGETDNDVNMATESSRDQGPPHNPVGGSCVPQQDHRRIDSEGDNSFPPARAHWQYTESSSSNPPASSSPHPTSPGSHHPKYPTGSQEHSRHQCGFQATTSSASHLPSTREKLKHQFRQMQRVCRALRSERRKLLRERKRLHDERQRLENVRTGTGRR